MTTLTANGYHLLPATDRELVDQWMRLAHLDRNDVATLRLTDDGKTEATVYLRNDQGKRYLIGDEAAKKIVIVPSRAPIE